MFRAPKKICITLIFLFSSLFLFLFEFIFFTLLVIALNNVVVKESKLLVSD